MNKTTNLLINREKDISYVAIAIKPTKDVGKLISKISEDIHHKYDTWWCLNYEIFPPHITLWLGYIPTKNICKLKYASKKIIEKIVPFEITIQDLYTDESGFIGLNIINQESCYNIHKQFIEKLNKFREGYLHSKYINNFDKYDFETQEILKKYGTRFAGKKYYPHITLNIVKQDQVECIKSDYNNFAASFIFHEIIIFKQKESGKSIDLIATYKL